MAYKSEKASNQFLSLCSLVSFIWVCNSSPRHTDLPVEVVQAKHPTEYIHAYRRGFMCGEQKKQQGAQKSWKLLQEPGHVGWHHPATGGGVLITSVKCRGLPETQQVQQWTQDEDDAQVLQHDSLALHGGGKCVCRWGADVLVSVKVRVRLQVLVLLCGVLYWTVTGNGSTLLVWSAPPP